MIKNIFVKKTRELILARNKCRAFLRGSKFSIDYNLLIGNFVGIPGGKDWYLDSDSLLDGKMWKLLKVVQSQYYI